ncbi:hypothetical protein SPOG_02275 [Schizosaccharomyces cryophilus OY26]|uniref:Uncharacterized protein n=1 Tax=Schizosaccharomyces cryophilus (strain OY26 / ATCC MYA-4695 / CBS 11777 / NBRC 106824 / NRRL Y48691) TaxID=653667 RepID=S9X1W5_SCHCR|nr:uncharacterized protein SPOG_02275 [Schizosaccharomyces cryophilus OY26]EPY51097.1 hypothetical protein SPOG_02275 [Schizosaccharomyces cryophilus OY26]
MEASCIERNVSSRQRIRDLFEELEITDNFAKYFDWHLNVVCATKNIIHQINSQYDNGDVIWMIFIQTLVSAVSTNTHLLTLIGQNVTKNQLEDVYN